MSPELKNETNPTADHNRRHAAKHGLAARMFEPRSFDPEIVHERNDAWMEVLNPQAGPVEAFLVEQAVRISFRLERCDAGKKAMLVAALEELFEPQNSEPNEPIDKRNSPADQIKLLIRYEMHSERTLERLINDLNERAWDSLDEAAQLQPIPARNEPKPAPTSVPNEPILAQNSARNEPIFAPTSIEEAIAEPSQSSQTEPKLPVDPETLETIRRMAESYAPKDSTADDQ